MTELLRDLDQRTANVLHIVVRKIIGGTHRLHSKVSGQRSLEDDHFPPHHGHQGVYLQDVIDRNGEVVSVNDQKIGKLAHFQGTKLVLLLNIFGCLDREHLQSLHPVNALFTLPDLSVVLSGDPCQAMKKGG